MASPKPKTGARIVALPVASGQMVYPGDILGCATSSDGWHVVLAAHQPPMGGYPAGYSDNNVHFSVGPSQTGAGASPGFGDGRIGGGANGLPSF